MRKLSVFVILLIAFAAITLSLPYGGEAEESANPYPAAIQFMMRRISQETQLDMENVPNKLWLSAQLTQGCVNESGTSAWFTTKYTVEQLKPPDPRPPFFITEYYVENYTPEFGYEHVATWLCAVARGWETWCMIGRTGPQAPGFTFEINDAKVYHYRDSVYEYETEVVNVFEDYPTTLDMNRPGAFAGVCPESYLSSIMAPYPAGGRPPVFATATPRSGLGG